MDALNVLGTRIWDRIQDEPVATQAIIVAAIAVATAFGLSWTADQVAAVTGFTALFLGWLTRKTVTPTAKLP